MLVWNQPLGAHQVGDRRQPVSSLEEALAGSDLVLGDLRRLPFASGVFVKAYSLDVFEHLSPAALDDVLKEMARVIEPGGHLFVYSHVRKNSRLALGLVRSIASLAALERIGLIDLRQERLRKSDHLNPLADIPDLETRGGRGRIPYRADPLLHAAHRWLHREHPDADGGARARTWSAAASSGRAEAIRRTRRHDSRARQPSGISIVVVPS